MLFLHRQMRWHKDFKLRHLDGEGTEITAYNRAIGAYAGLGWVSSFIPGTTAFEARRRLSQFLKQQRQAIWERNKDIWLKDLTHFMRGYTSWAAPRNFRPVYRSGQFLLAITLLGIAIFAWNVWPLSALITLIAVSAGLFYSSIEPGFLLKFSGWMSREKPNDAPPNGGPYDQSLGWLGIYMARSFGQFRLRGPADLLAQFPGLFEIKNMFFPSYDDRSVTGYLVLLGALKLKPNYDLYLSLLCNPIHLTKSAVNFIWRCVASFFDVLGYLLPAFCAKPIKGIKALVNLPFFLACGVLEFLQPLGKIPYLITREVIVQAKEINSFWSHVHLGSGEISASLVGSNDEVVNGKLDENTFYSSPVETRKNAAEAEIDDNETNDLSFAAD